MIDLIVTDCEQPQQPREEIARLLKEYGVGAVCLTREGGVVHVVKIEDETADFSDICRRFLNTGMLSAFGKRKNGGDIIRVFPPGTRLRVTVEVVE